MKKQKGGGKVVGPLPYRVRRPCMLWYKCTSATYITLSLGTRLFAHGGIVWKTAHNTSGSDTKNLQTTASINGTLIPRC